MPLSLQCYGATSIMVSQLVQGNPDVTECILNSLKDSDIQQSRKFREKNTQRFRRLYGEAYQKICDEICPTHTIRPLIYRRCINKLYNQYNQYDNIILMMSSRYNNYYIDEFVPHGRAGRRINRRGNRQLRKRRLTELKRHTYQKKHHIVKNKI